jgi:hypothetical protein
MAKGCGGIEEEAVKIINDIVLGLSACLLLAACTNVPLSQQPGSM